MKAVISAILLDEEARSCDWLQNPTNGMLRGPIVRYLHFSRAIEMDSPMGYYWNNGFSFMESTKQHPLMSPTVFNFFLPDYQPVGDFTDQGIYGPEFQIHDTQSSIGYINQVNQWTIWETLFWSWEEIDVVRPNTTALENVAGDSEELINYLDNLFTHGRLSDDTRNVIRESINFIQDPMYYREKVAMALYLIMISPDYVILK